MTKTLRNNLIAIFLTVAAIFAGAFCIVGVTSARAGDVEITKGELSDARYGFTSGAALWWTITSPTTPGAYEIRHTLELEDVDLLNLKNVTPGIYETWWGYYGGTHDRADNVFMFEFTLYRENRDGDGQGNYITARPQSSVLIVIYPDESGVWYGYVAEKDYYGNGAIRTTDGWLDGTEVNRDTYFKSAANGYTFNIGGVNQTFGKGYTVKNVYRLNVNGINFTNGVIRPEGLLKGIIADVMSPYQYYFMEMRYAYRVCTFSGIFETNYKNTYGEIYSSSRSVADLLNRYIDMNYLTINQQDDTGTFGGIALQTSQVKVIKDILRDDATETVKVMYLQEIEGTPFATPVFATVDVPVIQQTVAKVDVAKALGIDEDVLSHCLDSNGNCFEKTSDVENGTYYKMKYLKNYWLRSVTVDGEYLDYFLDINGSYKDVYLPYVNSGLLTNDIYEYIYSTRFLNKYPELQNYTFNQVYGYFGLVMIPETNTLNTAFKTMFDLDTSKIGVVSNFMFEKQISFDDYQALLDDYEYGFLSKVWSEVAGFVTGSEHRARFYVLYSEPGTESGLIGEGGQTDAENPGSVTSNKIGKPLLQGIGNIFENVLDFFTWGTSNLKILLFVALGVAVVIVVIKIKKRRK